MRARKKQRVELSEDAARELAEEWCLPLYNVACPTLRGVEAFDFVYYSVDVDLYTLRDGRLPCPHDINEMVRIRGAPEFLNTLACCPGFDPAENRLFWRSLVRRFFRGQEHVQVPFHQHTFRRILFSDHWYKLVGDSLVHHWLSALCVLVSTHEESPAMKIRANAISALQLFLRKSPGMLQFYLPDSGWDRNLEPVLQYLQDRARPIQDSKSRAIQVTSNPCAKFSRITSSSDIHIVEIGILENEDTNNQVSFLLREVMRMKTLQRLTMSAKTSGFAALVCSCVPKMPSLRSLYLDFVETLTSAAQGQIFDWLFWAVMHPDTRDNALEMLEIVGANSPLSAGSFGSQPNLSSYVRAGESDHSNFQTHMTALLRAQACPTSRIDGHGTLVVTTAAERVDVVALSNDKAFFVLPGFGLTWIEISALSKWSGESRNWYVSHMNPELVEFASLSVNRTEELILPEYCSSLDQN